jgi:hypothetical protein
MKNEVIFGLLICLRGQGQKSWEARKYDGGQSAAEYYQTRDCKLVLISNAVES